MKWIKQKLKKAKKWLIVIFIGATVYGATLAITPISIDERIAIDLPALKQLVETDRQPNGKYKFRPKKIINGVAYTVHEYEDPKGNIGYTIFVEKEVGGAKYKMATGTGIEKRSRVYGWKGLSAIATTTK